MARAVGGRVGRPEAKRGSPATWATSSCRLVAHVLLVGAGTQVVGAEAGRVVAAVQDVERAGQVEAEEQRGREPVHRVATVGDGDPSVAPAVAAALPLPTAGQRVDCPPCEQAFKEPQIVRSQSVASLHLGCADRRTTAWSSY